MILYIVLIYNTSSAFVNQIQMRNSINLCGVFRPLAIIYIVFIVFISCKKESLLNADKIFVVENAAGKKTNSAISDYIRSKGILLDIHDLWFMQCNNEYVYVAGKIFYTINSIQNGNMLHINYQFHYQNVHGIGQTTGAKYTFTGHASEQQNLYFDPAIGFVPKTFNITNKLITTTQGGSNSVTSISYHIITNSKGDLIVNKVNFNINMCR